MGVQLRIRADYGRRRQSIRFNEGRRSFRTQGRHRRRHHVFETFKNNLNLTNDDAASVMAGLSYLQIYIDSDGDVAMDYSIAKFGARRCNDDLNELIKLFIGLVDEAESRMAELERSEERGQTGRRPLSDFLTNLTKQHSSTLGSKFDIDPPINLVHREEVEASYD